MFLENLRKINMKILILNKKKFIIYSLIGLIQNKLKFQIHYNLIYLILNIIIYINLIINYYII